MDDWRHGGFGIYVHWPFCQAKCPYCDFNSHVRQTVDQSDWRDALVTELRNSSIGLENRTVDTVYFGGGTPSLMEPKTVAAVINEIDQIWGLKQWTEITMEANPTSVEASHFAGYKSAGVNRVSIGIQALNDHDLKRLGRLHSVAEAQQALDIAHKNFERVSFDLIYARQNQSLSAWKQELSEACNMAGDHLSLYQLTIEQDTRFGELHAKGRLSGLPEDDLAADMFEVTQEICNQNGLAAYEVSNHARSGSEGRHNLVYWRYGDYLGIGPGAHGRVSRNDGKFATVTERMPEKWLNKVNSIGTGTTDNTLVSLTEQAEECVMMGLRLSEGIDFSRLESSFNYHIKPEKISKLIELGLIESNSSRIMTTLKGRSLLNYIIRELLIG